MNHKQALITGGLGFIGSAVTELLLKRGTRVTVIDSNVSNVIDGVGLTSRFDDVQVVEASVSDFFKDGGTVEGYDLVLHAASHVGPAAILDYEGTIAHSIVENTAITVDACCAADVPLVYFSSAEVYGKSGILIEDSDIRVPPYYNARIEYALAKLTSEAMVLNSAVRGLRAVVIRPFNVVGPLQSRAGGFVLPTFVQQALGNQPMTVFETGKQRRAFLAAGDLARFLGDYVTDEVLADPKVYNVGNPDNAISVEDLAHRVRELLGSDSEIVYVDPKTIYGPRYFEAESFEKVPNIRNASGLGWSPQLNLDDIIMQTAEYYKANHDTRGADARGALAAMGSSPSWASTERPSVPTA